MPTSSLMAFVSIRVIRVTRDIVYLISAYVCIVRVASRQDLDGSNDE